MKTSKVQNRAAAFTLLELLVVLAVLGLLVSVLSTGMTRSGPNVQSVLCLSYKYQLGQAWRMYSDDNFGRLPPNLDGGNAGKASIEPSWAGGWLDFTPSTDNTNTDFLINHAKYPYAALMGPYVKTASVFKCPADKSVVFISGIRFPRVRTVSMNNLTASLGRTWSASSKYSLDKNSFDIIRPALKFVFLDEHEDSINDPTFLTDPDTLYQFIDMPASYHDNGCSFVFADCHTELHRWRDPRTTPPIKDATFIPLNVNSPGNQDALWLAQHAAGVPTYP